MSDYGTEVRLLAVTRLSDSSPVPSGGGTHGQSLVEWAGRLCYDNQDKFGTNPNWVQERIKDGHESILEHASATFYIRASRVFTHELVRHRIASYSQRSQRYVNESEPRYITPVPFQYVGKKYEGWFDNPASELFRKVMDICWDSYRQLLKVGVPKEIARYVLPNACETQIVMTMNFRELRHFIKLRTSERALPEMREVAGKVRDICKVIAPEVFEDV